MFIIQLNYFSIVISVLINILLELDGCALRMSFYYYQERLDKELIVSEIIRKKVE